MKFPNELTIGEVVPFFLQFARELLSPPLSTREVLDECIRFYRECRITGAPVEDGYDADTLCIECGNYPKSTAEIDDYRGKEDENCESSPRELQMSIRRIVHAVDALPEGSEFDDEGFEMDVTLYFGPTEDRVSFYLEVSTLEQLEAELPLLSQDELVSRLLAQTPTGTSAHVGGAG